MKCFMDTETRKAELSECYSEVRRSHNNFDQCAEAGEKLMVENTELTEENQKIKSQRNSLAGISLGLIVVSIFLGIF